MYKRMIFMNAEPDDTDIDPNNMGFDGPEGVDDDDSESKE